MASEDPRRPEADNPFQSPSVVTNADAVDIKVAAPSGALVLICAVFCATIKLVLYISFLGFSTENFFAYGILIFTGGVYGIGVAWLIHVVRTRQFALMMPGHWRLIAASTALITEVFTMALFHVQDLATGETDFFYVDLFFSGLGHLLAAIFYLLVINYNQERGIWRTYAWLAMIYYFLMAFLYPMLIGDLMGHLFIPLLVIQRLLTLALLCACLTGIVNDYRRRTPRDMYHYLGLVLGFALVWFSETELFQF
ncbi:hypothetical protein [Bremerella alba]|uniref:Uncharacterized protein n=1 Tax=Bremerella alba TaxID=980252 RepID=A0A7V8V7U9_9BACT|nr:hypothetical protein [Bremerella alba]MBA2116518.1 hypothetical protein [Bremerella alba]